MLEIILLSLAVIIVLVKIYQFKLAQKWHSTTAVIEQFSSQIIRDQEHKLDYSITLSYRYFVGDNSYTGDRLVLGMPNILSFSGATVDALAPYQQGREIEVFYNPNNPNESAIEVFKTRGKISPLIVMLFMVCIASALIIAGLSVIAD